MNKDYIRRADAARDQLNCIFVLYLPIWRVDADTKHATVQSIYITPSSFKILLNLQNSRSRVMHTDLSLLTDQKLSKRKKRLN